LKSTNYEGPYAWKEKNDDICNIATFDRKCLAFVGVQCPFYLSLVDSDFVRRDSADSFNEYVHLMHFFEIKPVWLSQKIFVATFGMSGTYAMKFLFYRRQILQHFVLCKFQLESMAMTNSSI